MRKLFKRFICFVLVVLLMFSDMVSYVSTVTAEAEDDTVMYLYEVSLMNSAGVMTSDTYVTCDEDIADSIDTFDSNSISKDMTFYSADGLWAISGYTDANFFTVTNYAYQGADLTVECRIPDKFVFKFFSSRDSEKVGDDENPVTEYTFTASTLSAYVSNIGTSFNEKNNSVCTNMNIIVPKRVTSIDDNAFYNNTKLTSIAFEGDIQTIGSSAFYGCTRLKTLDLAGVFDTVATNTIPKQCFYKCSSLENIIIPDTILNIGDEAFYQCDKIDYLVLSDSIKTIGKNAFAMCSNLRYLYIESTYSDWQNVVDETERYKLITEKVDASPLVTVKGGNTSISSQIFGASKIAIISKVDMDISTLEVKRDGVAVDLIEFENNAYGYKTKAVYFEVKKEDKGEYSVRGKDILGNEVDFTFKFISEVNDTTKPLITVQGTGSDNCYSDVTITWEDKETYVSEVKYDGVAFIGDKIVEDIEGEHTISVTDVFGNTSTHTFIIDKTTPTLDGINDTGMYEKSPNISINETGSGLKSVTLNGVELNNYNNIKVYETGTYTLVVTDKALNKLSYTFVFDSDGPSLIGVDNGGVYNSDVKITTSSECGISSISVRYDSYSDISKNYNVTNGATLTEEGKYTVTITDVLYNKATYNFIVDKTKPSISGVSNNKYYKDSEIKITVSDNNISSIYINNSLNNRNSISIKDDGKYTLKAVDKGGNMSTVTFIKDSKVPYVSGVKDGGKYKKGVTLKVSDRYGVKSIKLNNKTISKNYKVTKNGNYTLVTTDKAGNKGVVKFTIDSVKPTVSIRNNAKYNRSVTIKASDSISKVAKITLNGKTIKDRYKVEKDGKYTLVVTDNCNNKLSVKFTVDRTKPYCSNIKHKSEVKRGTILYAKDDGTGVMSVLLNGKKIKSGYRLTKTGKYDLVIFDKCGNKSKKITFTVK